MRRGPRNIARTERVISAGIVPALEQRLGQQLSAGGEGTRAASGPRARWARRAPGVVSNSTEMMSTPEMPSTRA